jgi:hypothetical protein
MIKIITVCDRCGDEEHHKCNNMGEADKVAGKMPSYKNTATKIDMSICGSCNEKYLKVLADINKRLEEFWNGN